LRVVQLHTFFQLPLEEYPATDGSRTQRALHALIFDPHDGLIAVMLEREAAGALERRTASCISSIFFPSRMRIARAELFELTLPLVEPFVISGGTMKERRSPHRRLVRRRGPRRVR